MQEVGNIAGLRRIRGMSAISEAEKKTSHSHDHGLSVPMAMVEEVCCQDPACCILKKKASCQSKQDYYASYCSQVEAHTVNFFETRISKTN